MLKIESKVNYSMFVIDYHYSNFRRFDQTKLNFDQISYTKTIFVKLHWSKYPLKYTIKYIYIQEIMNFSISLLKCIIQDKNVIYLNKRNTAIKQFFENCHLETPKNFEKIGTDGIQAKN